MILKKTAMPEVLYIGRYSSMYLIWVQFFLSPVLGG